MPGPRVGVGIIVLRDNKVLMGLRRGNHGDGEWCFPGGGVEDGESVHDAACRELREEAGIVVEKLEFVCLVDIDPYKIGHVACGFVLNGTDQEPATRPDEKIGDWQWFSLDELPENMFRSSEEMIKAYRDTRHYCGAE